MAKQRRLTERRFIATEAAPLTVQAPEDGKPPELVGYSAVFDQWATIRDWVGDAWEERFAPGAFAKTLQEADVRALWNHDPNVVLGRNRAGTLDLVEDGHGLRSVIRPPDNEWGRPVLDGVRRGDITGQSIGFQVVKEAWEKPTQRGGLARRTINEVRLIDVSVVTFPAYQQTEVFARAAEESDGDQVLHEACRLALMAVRGYPLADEERALVGQGAVLLRNWAGEPAAATAAGHSAESGRAEPGVPEGAHYSVTDWRDQAARMAEFLNRRQA